MVISMYRKYIENLKRWLNSPFRKPLMVWGARQVGKTYLIKEIFAEEFFKGNYIYIDCKNDDKFVDYCEKNSKVEDIIKYLEIEHKRKITKDVLIIFDEVQECLPIVSAMKYFCQNHRELPIIVTGSMARIKIQRENRKRGSGKKKKFLFPVGKINELTIYQMNFEEYLINSNKVLYDAICEGYAKKEPLDDFTHQKAFEAFYDYLLIGGMPEVVDVYLKTDSYQQARETLIELYNNYLGDMDLYQASPESIVRAKKIFHNIYSQLNKESKNFSPSLVENGLRNRDVASPIDWLDFAYLVFKSSLIKENVTLPLMSSDDSLYRLYLADIGLFSYQSKMTPSFFLSDNGRNSLSGIFFENYVAIELANVGLPLFYWKGKGDSEFEFIIQNEEYAVPIDVKKSRGSLNSLKKYKERNKFEYAVKISKNKYGFDGDNGILTIPFYDTFLFCKEIVEKQKLPK